MIPFLKASRKENTPRPNHFLSPPQVSPCPGPLQSVQLTERRRSTSHSPKERRASSSFLHPDHARFLRLQKCVSTDFTALDDETTQGGGVNNGSMNSSSASSMASIAQRHSEAWERRRSSVMTARYAPRVTVMPLTCDATVTRYVGMSGILTVMMVKYDQNVI
jgi:hypothetical protein